jgi:hypothetical protein
LSGKVAMVEKDKLADIVKSQVPQSMQGTPRFYIDPGYRRGTRQVKEWGDHGREISFYLRYLTLLY